MFRPRVLLLSALCSLPSALFAQTAAQIDKCPFDRPLIEPPVLEASGGKVETTLTVRMANDVEVPVWINLNGFDKPPNYKCSMAKMDLRRYNWPSGSGTATGFTGPTFRLRKAASRDTMGDALTIHLVNELPVAPNDQCNAGCDCSDPNNLPRCCQANDVYPACFHGDNNTNIHFHGTHASPQPPQDYVLLELRPKNSPPAGTGTHKHGIVANGTYDYMLDPFRYTQSPGTHWYHPHKHGSTALQVANGMAGALIIEGQFDDDLRALFGGKLKEHVLVLQLIHELNFTTSNQLATQPLINGQASPVIDMYPGEIRRLRFIGATVQADGAATIDFNSPKDHPVEVKQIAMDGVQFAPKNYERQPMLEDSREFDLAPGNRADFLVKAPNAPGTYDVTYELRVPEVGQRKLNSNDHDLKEATEQIAPGEDEPRLFRIRVVKCPAGQTCAPMEFPKVADFPKLPDFLADITDKDVSFRRRNLYFELGDSKGNRLPANKIPSQPSQFFINLQPNERRQFNPACVDITTRLGQAEEWTITNTSHREPMKPLHIFHIHTNPFQIIHHPLKTKLNSPPYVWQDSVLLPDFTQGPIVIRQKYEEFTGEYVLHCHFLGHEDRGMMLGVQTVCADDPSKFGKAIPNKPDDCKAPIAAAPQCYGGPPKHDH